MCAKLLKRFVGAFAYPARVGVVNELWVEIRVEYAVDSMMQQSVAYAGFVDVLGFGVADAKAVVGGVGVGFGTEVVVEGKEILF